MYGFYWATLYWWQARNVMYLKCSSKFKGQIEQVYSDEQSVICPTNDWHLATTFCCSYSIARIKFIQAASLTEWDTRLAHYFGPFGGLGLLLGYLATSGAKFDVKFLLGGLNFLQRQWNFVPILLSFQDLKWGRQKTDKWQTTDAATKTEGSHIVSVQAEKHTDKELLLFSMCYPLRHWGLS